MTSVKIQWTLGAMAAGLLVSAGSVWGFGNAIEAAPPVALPAATVEGPTPTPGKDEPAERKSNATQRLRSLNNLKQIALAMLNYDDANRVLPTDIRDKEGNPILSWRVLLLPYLEQDALYREFKLDEPWDGEHNEKLLAKLPPPYRAGFEPKGSIDTYYQVFAGLGTPFDSRFVERVPGGEPPNRFKSTTRLVQITDGTSNTLGVVEAGPPVPWTKPADIVYDPKKPIPALVGPFSNVLHAATMDCGTHALRRNIDPKVFKNLIEANDGELVPELKTFYVPMPANTPEEKLEVQEQREQNRKRIDEIEGLMKELARLLAVKNLMVDDPILAADHAKHLEDVVRSLKAMNKKQRDDLGLRDGARIPTDKELGK